MSLDRRSFLGGLAAAGAAHIAATPTASAQDSSPRPDAGSDPRGAPQSVADRFDPWIEVIPSALAHNVGVVRRLTAQRPILAVIKNNAYGLGLTGTARLLHAHDEIVGFAVVKPEDALTLRSAGVTKPVLLMGMAPDSEVRALVEAGVHLSLYLDDDAERLPALAPADSTIAAHVYLDTGMGRMGMAYHRALPWLEGIETSGAFRIDGVFMGFTEQTDFDREQLQRFEAVALGAARAGVSLRTRHAASSNGVYHLPEAHLDMVRPGIALFGGYPSRPDEEREIAVLEPAFSLKSRVVRVEQLRRGDSVSYGRNYVAEEPTWIATLPAGHVDGYPRRAVDGARIAIGGATYPVIGAVSASHIIVELGTETDVAVGDVATLLGAGPSEVHPNEVARVTGASVYDLFMHLNPSLPRITV